MITPNLFVVSYLLAWILAIRNTFHSQVKRRSAWRVSAILLSIGLSMILAFCLIGSTVDEEGILHEEFPLIALGSLFSLAGLCVTLVLMLINLLGKIITYLGR